MPSTAARCDGQCAPCSSGKRAACVPLPPELEAVRRIQSLLQRRVTMDEAIAMVKALPTSPSRWEGIKTLLRRLFRINEQVTSTRSWEASICGLVPGGLQPSDELWVYEENEWGSYELGLAVVRDGEVVGVWPDAPDGLGHEHKSG